MKSLLKLFLVSITFMATSLFALQEDTIKSEMTIKIENATKVLQNKNIKKDEIQKEIFAIFDDVFDYSLMAKLSLGSQYKALNDSQIKEFSDIFEQRLKSSYIDKLSLYTDEKVVVKETKKLKSTRIELLTDIIGKEDTYEVIYKFYKDKKNEWYIYDVSIIGVSIIQTYRKQFEGVVSNGNFDELIKKLNEKMEEKK